MKYAVSEEFISYLRLLSDDGYRERIKALRARFRLRVSSAPESWTVAAPARAASAVLRWYQHWISPWLPGACRYWPTCSEYARLVIARHGVLRGGVAALKRLLRCQPLFPGGFDPPR